MSTIIDSLEAGVRRPEETRTAEAVTPASRLQSPVCDLPFRHVVIDDWAPPELVRAAETEWPDDHWPFWHRYENGKLATKDPLRYPPACAELVRRMLCLPIAELMGIEDAFGDWNCHAAGLHAMPPGSSLGVHLDSDHHPITGWRRACNAVLYLNSHWQPDWGGHFQLLDPAGQLPVKQITPRFNRLMLFQPSDIAYHAVSQIRGPETRKSLTVFFWTQSASSDQRRSSAQFVDEIRK